ncbi:MAG TPA: trypsin-like peptidase domain-containing protein [Oscillospiraceae bacterium]|nr:trypsin-like peptidase domain-containing protein [Oscillospiraceae bacterium]
MNDFDNGNGFRDESVDFTGENYNSHDDTEPEDEKVMRSQDISEEIAMENIWRENSRRNTKNRRGVISTALIGAILGSAITLGATYVFLPDILDSRGIFREDIPQRQEQININPVQDLGVYTAVAKKAMPSVVGITTVELQRDWPFGLREVSGLGTGVIIDKRGYILTNSHVVRDGKAREVKVLVSDGKQLKAEVLWNETSLDLAIIKVDGSNLPIAELGDSDEIEVGEIAVAIGNPLGLNFQRSLTQGVISGLNRTITDGSSGITIENLIQTDASINPGNSGGPLLNSKGQVIGINTVKVTSGEGLGFAIPINTAKPIVDQFIEKGEFTRVYLGLQGVDTDYFETITGSKSPVDNGVYIFQIEKNSVASRYGIKVGDIIIKIDDTDINKRSDLVRTIYKYRPGESATITVLRENKEIKLDVVFD